MSPSSAGTLSLTPSQTWTSSEEIILLEQFKVYGRRWKSIANYLPGRCESNIKNKFYSLQRKAIIQNEFQEKYKNLAALPSKKETVEGPGWVEGVIQKKKNDIKDEIDGKEFDGGGGSEDNRSWNSPSKGKRSSASSDSDEKQLGFEERSRDDAIEKRGPKFGKLYEYLDY